jgi:hypothetical protein
VSQGLAGLAYQLKLDNTNTTIGTSASGILFSAGGDGVERGKGALVYRCEDTWNRGSFYFLQNTALSTANPTMSNAVMTIQNDGYVGVGTTDPAYRLDVSGQVRGWGVIGMSATSYTTGKLGNELDGVFGETDEADGAGIWGQNVGASGWAIIGSGPRGICGYADAEGVGTFPAIYGRGHDGVVGDTYGADGDLAGIFWDNVRVYGIIEYWLARSTTDHPVDPDNKVLRTAAVEAPEQLQLYRGSVTLDESGEATVVLPSYFTALVDESEATVNLTPVGRSHADQRYESSYEWEPTLDRFRVYGEPGRKIAWLVLAERDDASARAHPMLVEEEKGEAIRCPKGRLLDPEAFGQPRATLLMDNVERAILDRANRNVAKQRME